MIQRIQTLWLLLAACCMGVCFLVPVATFSLADWPTEGQRMEARLDLTARNTGDVALQMTEPVVHYAQRMTGMSTWPLVTLSLLCIAVSVAAICLFRRRPLQLRMVALAFFVCLVYAFVLLFWAVDRYSELLSDGLGGVEPEVTWGVGAFAPLLALVFFFLAQRAIKRDEALVRAADRLR